MKKIASFTVNHDTLEKGVYISRIDGDVVTYDLRFCKPNTGVILDNSAIHTTEHMLATFLRNSEISFKQLQIIILFITDLLYNLLHQKATVFAGFPA